MRLAWGLAGAIMIAGTTTGVAAQTEGGAETSAKSGDTVTLSDVDVAVVNPIGPGDPPPRSRGDAVNKPGQNLQLDYKAGDAIDADFVRKQFLHNGLIGRPVTEAALIDLVQLINAALIREGYVNSGVVLEQQPALKDGDRLKLKLVYGRLGGAGRPGVRIEWGGHKRGLSDSFIARRMPSTTRTPVNAAEIERDFRLLADDPSIRSVRAELRGGTEPGQAQLALAVEPAYPYDLYLTYANNRTPSVGAERAAIGGSARNLLTGTDLFAFEVGRTKGLDDAVVSYSTPLFSNDLRLTGRAGLNNAAVVDPALLALDISARDRFVEGGLSYIIAQRPLTPAGEGGWISARSVSAGLTFVHRRTVTKLFGEPFPFSPGSVRGRAEYSAVRASFDFLDRGPRQALTASLIGTLGLEGTRGNAPGVLQPPTNFITLVGQVNYARRLTPQRMELRARLAGQWTNDVLYTAERFSIGGATTVRGYRESLILSDRGVIGSVELAQPFDLSPDSRPGNFSWTSFSASAFADGAYFDDVGPSSESTKWIGSLGASLAWTPSDALVARITYGEPLKHIRLIGRRDLQDRGFSFMITLRPLLLFGVR